GHDSDLLAGRANKSDFRYPDTVVDTRFSADVTSNVTSVPNRAGPGSGNSHRSPCKAKAPHGLHAGPPRARQRRKLMPALRRHATSQDPVIRTRYVRPPNQRLAG
ncbi:MAG: hypothetical protein ACTHKL_12430, partial [Streptosporangiaceae bacterium]